MQKRPEDEKGRDLKKAELAEDMNTASFWLRTTPDAGCPALLDSVDADVAIIGGGLTGLHAALKILEDDPGKEVVLVEANRICADASGRTLGKVTSSHSRIYPRLSPAIGRVYAEANKAGFDRILNLVETYAIDCDLQRVAHYILASTDARVDQVRKDFEAMKNSGLDVEWVKPHKGESSELPLEFLVGIKHADQAVYHPRKFAFGLLRAIKFLGGHVYEHTRATGLVEHRGGVTITLEGGKKLKAKKVIVATRVGLDAHEPFAASLSFWRSHMAAYTFERESIKNAYTRYEIPVASLRPHKNDLLLGGRDADALPSEDERHYRAMDAWVRQAYPEQRDAATEDIFFWWGEDADSADRLPLIGAYRKDSSRVFMATGYCGWGMTKSAFSGLMLSDLVAGKSSPYQDHFDPWRF